MLTVNQLLTIVLNPSALHKHLMELHSMYSERAQIGMSNPKWQNLSMKINNSETVWGSCFERALQIIIIEKNIESLRALQTYPLTQSLLRTASYNPLYLLAKQDSAPMFLALLPSLRPINQQDYSKLISLAGEKIKTYLENRADLARFRAKAPKVSPISFLADGQAKPIDDTNVSASEETPSPTLK